MIPKRLEIYAKEHTDEAKREKPWRTREEVRLQLKLHQEEIRLQRELQREHNDELRARALAKKPIRRKYNDCKAWGATLLGGCCQRCGYSEFNAALHFHHIDPLAKTKTLAACMATDDDSTIMVELDKCVLLCGNCHQAFHKGSLSIVFVKRQELGWTCESPGSRTDC